MRDRISSFPATILLTFLFSSHFFLSFDMFSYNHIRLLQTLEAVHSASLTCILANSPCCTRAIDLPVLSSSVLLFPPLFFSVLGRKHQWTGYQGSSRRTITLRRADSLPEGEEQTGDKIIGMAASQS